VTKLAESAKRWRTGNALATLARAKKPPVGTTFSFDLNVGATARLAFSRSTAGRKVGGKCVRPTRANRRKPSCKRLVGAGALKLAAHAGTDKVRFQGRISRTRKLKPGRYKMTLTATDATGRRSVPHSLSFRIVRPPRS
jgi:hypothetical protein